MRALRAHIRFISFVGAVTTLTQGGQPEKVRKYTMYPKAEGSRGPPRPPGGVQGRSPIGGPEAKPLGKSYDFHHNILSIGNFSNHL